MNAHTSEPGTPGKIFRAPLVAPCLESVSLSKDEFTAGTADALGLAGEISRARCAYEESVAEAAYFLAHCRGFEPGHELDDWIAAEAQIATASKQAESRLEEQTS